MKTLVLIAIIFGAYSVAMAADMAGEAQTSQETTSHSYTGAKAEAKYNSMPGVGVVNGPIALCRHVASKLQRAKDGLTQTECTETVSSEECGVALTKYSCTETESLDGKPLPNTPLAVAL